MWTVLTIVGFAFLIGILTYIIQRYGDDSSTQSHGDNSSTQLQGNKLLKRIVAVAVVALAIVEFVGPYIVDWVGNLEKNPVEAFLDMCEDFFSQDAEAGTVLEGNSIITGNMNLEEMFKMVPEVKERSQEEAEEILEKAGILWEVGDSAYSDTVEAGIVLSQTPKAGAIVDKNTKVTLIISKGKELIQVPNVVGLSKEKASNKLKKARLKVTEEEEYSDDEEGNVIRQSVNEGENVSPGAEIIIVISKGAKPEENKPKPTATPKPPVPTPTATPAPPAPTPTATPAPPAPTPTPTPTLHEDDINEWDWIN